MERSGIGTTPPRGRVGTSGGRPPCPTHLTPGPFPTKEGGGTTEGGRPLLCRLSSAVGAGTAGFAEGVAGGGEEAVDAPTSDGADEDMGVLAEGGAVEL